MNAVGLGLMLVVAYLLGATPTSYLAARLGRGIDLREHGSRNLGATNVYRVLGWRYALPVAVVDVAKGAVPVAILGPWADGPPWFPAALGVAAVLGHMFSPYVRFRGGKGVATAAGMFLALAPLALLVSLPVWALTLWLGGYVSLASIVAALLFPLWVRLTAPRASAAFWAAVALAGLIVVAHRSNLRRLLAGTEHRFRTRRGLGGLGGLGGPGGRGGPARPGGGV
jgi:glycerol-3-phosphate acyltransferase PlsY